MKSERIRNAILSNCGNAISTQYSNVPPVFACVIGDCISDTAIGHDIDDSLYSAIREKVNEV